MYFKETFESTVAILLLASGIYLTAAMRFFPFLKFKTVTKLIFKSLFSGKKDNSSNQKKLTPFQAVSTTLAGTLGVGSISGIAAAITIGGAGSVFWMLVSAFFGMSVKYAEIYLAVHFGTYKNGVGGPMRYLQKGLRSNILPAFFCISCVVASFGIGAMVQSNSIADSMSFSFNIPTYVSGICVTVLVGFVIIGSVHRIASFSEKIVPFMSIFYFALAVSSIFLNIERLFPAVKMIILDAFNFKSAAGGVFGFLSSSAVRYGISRGVFSNEAGLGSSPIAHACSSQSSPTDEGFLGIFEVFVDTVVMCTLTALVILTSSQAYPNLDASALTAACFSDTFGSLGEKFVSIAIVFFAVTSITGWCFYSEQCLKYLFEKPYYPILIYRILLLMSVLAGSVMQLKQVWAVSDFFNMAMALPNIFGVIILSPIVIRSTNKYFKKK